MSSNEEIAKTLIKLYDSAKSLSVLLSSIKSIQDKIVMLKCSATHSGLNPRPTGSQHSDIRCQQKPNNDVEVEDEEPDDADIELTG